MFTCPHCARGLEPQRGPKGVIYLCRSCGGHAASLSVLRKVFGPERVATIWADGGETSRCECPVCRQEMQRVTWMETDKAVTLDLCRRCEFVWFDATEYESLAPAPPPKRALGDIDPMTLPIDLREKLAMIKVEQIAREAQSDQEPPDLTWKMAPAIFGLPVEMDDATEGRNPVATYATTAAITVVSLWAFLLHWRLGVNAANVLGLIPSEASRLYGFTFVSSFFLHAGWWHLVGNLYFLVVFGRHVESYLGAWRWLLLTALAALVGDFIDLAFRSDSTLPLIGASGGISGLIAFYALQFPHARLGLLFSFRFYFRWINIPAWGAFALWVLMQFWGAFLELKHLGNVASIAHLGGVVAGLGFWFLWRKLDAKPAANVPGLPGMVMR